MLHIILIHFLLVCINERGYSTKPAAEAFCDATLLAQLRAEQWREMQEKGRPDVFVLVRNLKSAAYRVALATIVLEQQQDDLEFM